MDGIKIKSNKKTMKKNVLFQDSIITNDKINIKTELFSMKINQNQIIDFYKSKTYRNYFSYCNRIQVKDDDFNKSFQELYLESDAKVFSIQNIDENLKIRMFCNDTKIFVEYKQSNENEISIKRVIIPFCQNIDYSIKSFAKHGTIYTETYTQISIKTFVLENKFKIGSIVLIGSIVIKKLFL